MKNLKTTPQIILKSKSIGHPIDFKWNRKKMEQLLDPLEGNEELEDALANINHKASVGLTAALLEWVYWRFKGYTKTTTDTQKRIEALWCSIENIESTKPLDFDTDLNVPISGCINGPLWIALMNVRMVDVRYRKGSYFIQSEIIGLVLLARHITPKKKVFDKWFNKTITELNRSFPCPYSHTDLDMSDEEVYNSVDEPVISREFFFDVKFEYTNEASEKAIESFIENIDHKANPFLQLSREAS